LVLRPESSVDVWGFEVSPELSPKNIKKHTKHQKTICFRFWKGTEFQNNQNSPKHLALQDGQDPETLQAVMVTAKW
jgi:hypothetical protein